MELVITIKKLNLSLSLNPTVEITCEAPFIRGGIYIARKKKLYCRPKKQYH